VEGGVAENTPISHAIALAASEIYVLPTGHAYALERPPARSRCPVDFAHAAELVERLELHARAFLDGGRSERRPIAGWCHATPGRVRKRARASQRDDATR
jgi:NTE family protein